MRSNPSQNSSLKASTGMKMQSCKRKLVDADPSDLVNLGVDESITFTDDLRELGELAESAQNSEHLAEVNIEKSEEKQQNASSSNNQHCSQHCRESIMSRQKRVVTGKKFTAYAGNELSDIGCDDV